LIPAEQEANYPEQVLRLPHAFASRWRQPMAGISRSNFGLPDEAVVFCCFNRGDKITASTFSSWMTILEAVPGSLLWLAVKPQALQRLKAQAQKRGIDPDRLIAAPYQKPVERFIAAMACADLFLDTAGFNAGAIGVLALNAGLPLLTLAGERFCARMGASLCQAVHQPQLISATPETYEQKAIELATTPGAIDQLKEELRNTPQELPLFQQQRWVSSLVAALNA
jgi:predicted O-linked N-acetylglucosamine transferase (SPINDLY family)